MSADHRLAAGDLIRAACRSREPGVLLTSPIYEAVTEGRQSKTASQIQLWSQRDPRSRGPRPFYSSCGDLAHWLLYRLGVRFDWINRDEHDGWSFRGANNNVTTLYANQLARRVRPDSRFFTGDILIVGTAMPNTTHVTCVLEHVPEMEYLLTGDYGQPHGALRDAHPVFESEGKLWRGQRSVDVVLSLGEVVEAARAAGKLESIETAQQWLQRIGVA